MVTRGAMGRRGGRGNWLSSAQRLGTALVLVGPLLACEQGVALIGTSPVAGGESTQVDRATVERLQALGYVDVVEDETVDERRGVVLHDEARSHPGYNFFTNAHLCLAQLVDDGGAVVQSWSLEPCFRWENASFFRNGDLLVIGRAGKQATAKGKVEGVTPYVARLRWNGEVVWKAPLAAHHDGQETPSGDVAVLTAKRMIVPEIDANRKIKDNEITVLDDEGRIIEQASLYKLLKTAPPEQFRFIEPELRKGPLDPIHANSIYWMSDPALAARDPLYAPSNLVVTIRHQDTVAVIDWTRKKVVWAWGQGEISGPHDAVVLPTGNVLVFDNGLGRGWSRVVELDPLSRRIVWEYRPGEGETFYTRTRGSNQRLPNGNTLIAESGRGRAFEVTRGGDIVWEFLNPNGIQATRGAIVRMRRIEPSVVQGWLAANGASGDRRADRNEAEATVSPPPRASCSRSRSFPS